MNTETTTKPAAENTNIHIHEHLQQQQHSQPDDNGDDQIINWVEEASAIIKDVKAHVAEIEISQILPSNESHIYLNIRTFEGATYCVHVSSMGFRIVSETFDTIDKDKEHIRHGGGVDDDEEEEEIFETPYALLDKISVRYVESFGNQLCKQLMHLQQMRTEFNEEDEEGLEEEEEEDEEDEEQHQQHTKTLV